MNHNIEVSSGNIYADLGTADAEEMQVKALFLDTTFTIAQSSVLFFTCRRNT
ncbi:MULTISPECIES: helix-turn-helix domain-containing protein [Photorhabdus]|uniref:hypothetical protein n=1 Tax=Photorhabdus TaxID=29487 RepID=UPI001E476687|nr:MULTISPECIES: hypothetical protein [Photorhabdus]MCT8353751.1 hypothetical protein [Photorhabdus kayaii]MDB6369760.1 hypothetical protein [Photorhabdus bodei]